MIALGRALAARGHEVTLETWRRWRAARRGARACASRPRRSTRSSRPRERPLKPYEAVRARRAVTRGSSSVGRARRGGRRHPHARARAGRRARGRAGGDAHPARRTRAAAPGLPPYSIGARLRARAAGPCGCGACRDPLLTRGLRAGARASSTRRARALGLPPLPCVHGGISRRLCLVATFPQLEYPRALAAAACRSSGRCCGSRRSGDVEPPPGDAPLVLVAPSTSQDPEHRLLRAALDGLAERAGARARHDEPARPLAAPLAVPANARLVDWLSYARTMPRCDVVVCHGGPRHGRARAGRAVRRRGRARRRRHGRERRAGRLGRRRACGCRGGCARPAPLRLAVRRALAEPRLAARARELARVGARARRRGAGGRARGGVRGRARERGDAGVGADASSPHGCSTTCCRCTSCLTHTLATTMATNPHTVAAGRDALRRGAWEEARGRFEAALAQEETPEACEGLGWVGWWLADAALAIGARERAYRAFRAAGDPAGAGRVAAWLASDFLEFRGEDAVARGWLERSHRMLDLLPEREEHGWLALNEGSTS